MAGLCKFYGWTPATVRGLTMREFRVFKQFASEMVRAQNGG